MEGSISEMLQLALEKANSNQISESIASYQKVISLDPQNATALFCLGVLYAQIGYLEDAIKSFEKSHKSYPNHGPTLANLATLLEKQDPVKASEYAILAKVSLPEDDNVTRIANYEATDSRPTKLFVKATAIVPDEESITEDLNQEVSHQSRKSKAKSFTTSGNHSSAVAIWKGLLDEAPESPEIWRGLGEALSAAGYDERSEQCMKRASSLEIKQEENTKEAKLEEIEQDDIEALMIAAEEAQSKTKEREPTRDIEDAIGWYNMGINLINEGKYDDAISSFEKAIGGCPPEEIELKINSHNARGNALYNASRYAESVIAYHTAIGIDPTSVKGKTLFNMGSSYAAVELFEDAIKCFSQAIEIGLDKDESILCEKQLSRCRLLAREQAKRQSRV